MSGNKRACVFLNLSSEHKKTWSTEGCSVVSSRTNITTTTCACDHMTLFAVLMDASGDTVTMLNNNVFSVKTVHDTHGFIEWRILLVSLNENKEKNNRSDKIT